MGLWLGSGWVWANVQDKVDRMVLRVLMHQVYVHEVVLYILWDSSSDGMITRQGQARAGCCNKGYETKYTR